MTVRSTGLDFMSRISFVPFGAAFAAREDDAAAAFIPGIALVLTQDEELDAVDGREFIQREAEGINLCRDSSLINIKGS